MSLPPWLLRLLSAGALAGWDFHPLESAAFSRRTPKADVILSSGLFRTVPVQISRSPREQALRER
jgi:hypothetical protein